MDVVVSIETDEWYPVYTPEKYDSFHVIQKINKIIVDQSLLDRWELCVEEFKTLQKIFEGLRGAQK